MLNIGSESVERLVFLMGFLWLVQSVGRLYFAVLGTPGGTGRFLDAPIPYETSLVIFVMFLLLGVLGLVAVIGLFGKWRWGLRATLLVSVATIVFDIWGFTIQSTAAIGFIVPVISIICLYWKRTQLLEVMK
ncbi:MAG: hypothetical protein QXP45_03560 [Thermoproteota archaeon]